MIDVGNEGFPGVRLSVELAAVSAAVVLEDEGIVALPLQICHIARYTGLAVGPSASFCARHFPHN